MDNYKNNESRVKSYIFQKFKRRPKRLFSIKTIMKTYDLDYLTARKYLLDMEKEGLLLKFEYDRSNMRLFVFNENHVEEVKIRRGGFF